MKSKGFTLVEILVVIVILSIVVGIAVPNMVSIQTNNKVQMFCAKTKNIEDAAKLYGEENMDDIEDAINKTMTLTVKDLIQVGKLKKEDDTCNFTDSKPCSTDPRDSTSMDKEKVTITIKNRRIVASYIYKGDDKDYCANK